MNCKIGSMNMIHRKIHIHLFYQDQNTQLGLKLVKIWRISQNVIFINFPKGANFCITGSYSHKDHITLQIIKKEQKQQYKDTSKAFTMKAIKSGKNWHCKRKKKRLMLTFKN